MTITVVTTRADNGAPATRDVYAAGVRYTTTNGDLQVISAGRAPLAFYGSGNWLSVYVDQCVTVISGETVVTAGDGSVDIGGVDVDGAPADADTGIAGEIDANGLAVAAEEMPATYVADRAGVIDEGDDRDYDGDDGLDAVETRSDARRQRGTSRPETGRPPWMRPVVIRPRTYVSPPPDPAPAPRNQRIRQVPIRAKTYVSPPEDVEPVPPRNPRMRRVTVRPRSHVPRPAVSEVDDNEDERGE